MDGAGARSIVDRDGFLTDLCMIANGTILLVGVSWFEFKVLLFGLNLYLCGQCACFASPNLSLLVNYPSTWSLYLSLALCVYHHSDRETSTAAKY